jgi:hypothetical protein
VLAVRFFLPGIDPSILEFEYEQRGRSVALAFALDCTVNAVLKIRKRRGEVLKKVFFGTQVL